MANLTTVSAILKEVYPGAIEDELNQEVALYRELSRRKQVQTQGKNIRAAFHVRRGAGIGSRGDNEVLPYPGSQTYASPTVNYGRTYKRGEITGPTIRDTWTDDAAFENALIAEVQFDLKDLVRDLARQWHAGDGILTTVNGAVTASTSVVVGSVQYLYVGQYVEFWNGATNQTTNDPGKSGTQITAINEGTNTLTVTTAQTIANNASVSLQGNRPWNAAGGTKEMQGLDTIVDDGTDYPAALYFGVDRSASGYPILQGNRMNAAGTLDEDKLQDAIDRARVRGGGIVDMMITDFTTRRKYANLLLQDRRYTVSGMAAPSYAGGFRQSKDREGNTGEGLTFDNVSIVPTQMARAAKMFFLDVNSFVVYCQSELEWVMNGDSILHPTMTATGVEAYQYSLYYEAQLFCNAPNRNTKMVSTY